ncbi:hypothetical protein IFM89_038731 [Coptis chinensis]|uniref:Uncharacterized protein n=1 Tax=Coptis chinensis TaxID=261450 RepID=A0A835HI84_9MAGN|nr:hypothetical protein IFM89_038731 [Coptis chinensis]
MGDVQVAADLEFHIVDPPLEEENEPVGDVAQSARDHDVHLSDPGPQEVNAIPVTSEPVSDIVSQSFEKVDITDIFTTDVVCCLWSSAVVMNSSSGLEMSEEQLGT